MMSEEDLFLSHTIYDLQQRNISGKRYDMIRAAGLIRQLLLDNEPLIHKVNKKYSAKIVFKVIAAQLEQLPTANVRAMAISPRNWAKAKTEDLRLDQFLKKTVATYGECRISVHTAILTCAHVMGGVHYGKPTSDNENATIELDKQLRNKDSTLIIEIMRDISSIVIDALAPLHSKIVEIHAESSSPQL
ncbi:hypothetical protein GCM10027214_06070 [Stenotrophomonas tumulicola]